MIQSHRGDVRILLVSRELSLLFLVHLDVHKLHSSLPLQRLDLVQPLLVKILFGLIGYLMKNLQPSLKCLPNEDILFKLKNTL